MDMSVPRASDVAGEPNDSDGVHIIPAPSSQQLVPMPEGATRAQMVWALSQRIPLNQYGLPIFFYRSDFLPSPALTGIPLTQGDVDAATVGLLYYEGYPTLPTGQSFWNQLPHEQYEPFMEFTKYLEQAKTLGIRQLDLLAAAVGRDLSDVVATSQEYFWGARSRAYDLFSAAAEQKRRALLIRDTENTHFDRAGDLFAKVMNRFTGEFNDWIEELSAKEAIEVMSELVKIQRLSLGLTGQHASSNAKLRDMPAEASPDYIMRELAKGATMGGDTDNMQAKLASLLEDADDGLVLQEMILRVGRQAVTTQ